MADPGWEHVACDLCGRDEPDLWFIKDGFRHVRCTVCGLVYVTPRRAAPDARQDRFYDGLARHLGDLEAAAVKDRRPRRRRHLAAEARGYRGYRQSGRLLDVGCGFGAFLAAARAEGWQPRGVEVAAGPAAIAAREFEVFAGPVEQAPFAAGSFDVIRLNNVIEHLPSPRAMVRTLAGLLRPGGLLAVATPNVDSLSVRVLGPHWRYIGGADHVYLFGPRTLRALLEAEGLRIRRVTAKGVHLTRKEAPRPATPGAADDGAAGGLRDEPAAPRPRRRRRGPLRPLTAMLEGLLDLALRGTTCGHRLKVQAEKPPAGAAAAHGAQLARGCLTVRR